MTVRCAEIEEALSAYADGEERASETLVVRSHVEACGACRATLGEWERLAVPMDEPLGDLPERVAARLRTAPDLRVVHAPRRAWIGKVLVAAALLAMAGGASIVGGVSDGDAARDASAGAEAPARGAASPTAPGTGPGKGTSRGAAGTAAAPVESTHPRPTDYPTTHYPTPAPSSPATARGADHELAIVLVLDRTRTTTGESIRAGFMLENISGDAVTFRAHEASPFDLVVTDIDGREIFRRSTAWQPTPVDRTLRPGERIGEAWSFAAPATPGGYLVRAECLCVRGIPGDGPSTTTPSRDHDAKGGTVGTSPLRMAVGPAGR